MRPVTACRCALLLPLLVAGVAAQAPPDFSGTWRLDPSRSRISEASGFAGLAKSGAPETLYVTQPRNGTLVVESSTNESHARLYRPGGTTSTPVTVGQNGSITITSRWDGPSLVGEGTREFTALPVARVKEVLSASADGRTLTIEITTTTASVGSVSSLTYVRTQSVGPCQSWPTPCKTSPR
jgi:hypothetical protein